MTRKGTKQTPEQIKARVEKSLITRRANAVKAKNYEDAMNEWYATHSPLPGIPDSEHELTPQLQALWKQWGQIQDSIKDLYTKRGKAKETNKEAITEKLLALEETRSDLRYQIRLLQRKTASSDQLTKADFPMPHKDDFF